MSCDYCYNEKICAKKENYQRIVKEFQDYITDEFSGYIKDNNIWFTTSINCNHYKEAKF